MDCRAGVRGSVAACRPAAPGLAHALRLSLLLGLVLVLAGGAVRAEFARVVPGQDLEFPADTGAHPAYRSEWWYITGWLTDEEGEDRGFQVTFFRVATGLGGENPSRFAPRQLLIAHAAIADRAHGQLRHAQRTERQVLPLAGAASGRTHAWIGDWVLELRNHRYYSRIDADDFALELVLTPPGPPVLNGADGVSQKTPDPANASYYYSRPQLDVRGTIELDGQAHPVTGHAWLDHEWSSEYLVDEAEGWDWIGINLHDGGSLMAFQMRHRDGSVIWAGATLRGGDGAREVLGPDQVRFEPLRRWQSPRSGVEYPIEWQLEIAGRRLQLRPLMDDQELDSRRSSGVVYWEGASRLYEGDREIGRGYLEMTGYWGRPPL